MGGQDFTIGRLQFHMRRDPDGSDLDLMFKADALQTHTLKAEKLQFYTTLNRAESLMALLRGEMPWPQATASWRAQGGKAKPSQVIAPGLAADGILSPLY
jgi:hypothetical protein